MVDFNDSDFTSVSAVVDVSNDSAISLVEPESAGMNNQGLPERQAGIKAAKTAASTQDDPSFSYKPADLKARFETGQDQDAREYLVTKRALDREGRKANLLNNYVSELAKQGVQTPEFAVSAIRNLSEAELADPNKVGTILEEKWAEYAVNRTLATNKDYATIQKRQSPSELISTDNVAVGFERHIANNEVLHDELSKVNKMAKEQGWGKFLAEFTTNNIVPFYRWYNTSAGR
jgi:hypothetical protein